MSKRTRREKKIGLNKTMYECRRYFRWMSRESKSIRKDSNISKSKFRLYLVDLYNTHKNIHR